MNRCLAILGLGAATLVAGGCVKRTLSIESEPAGALVWLNDREIGRTPVEVEFLHYGTYDVRLELDGYETLSTVGRADAPWWDVVGPDFVAELLPWEIRSDVAWRFELEPRADDAGEVRERAAELREALLTGRSVDELDDDEAPADDPPSETP